MTSGNDEQNAENEGAAKSVRLEQKDLIGSLNSSLAEIKESVERLTKSVGELNSKLRSTGDTLKWVLDVLSRRSEEKEILYLKNLEASTELLKHFMGFVESRVKPISGEAAAEAKESKTSKKEASAKEAPATPAKKGEEYLVKPSMIRKLQEEERKTEDKRSR